MKSLVIVNKKIEYEKNQLDYYLSVGIPKEELTTFYTEIKKLEAIKQDLDVLEIFYELFGDVAIDTYEWDGKKKAQINFVGSDYYTYASDEEEALKYWKLKKWLEENQNA